MYLISFDVCLNLAAHCLPSTIRNSYAPVPCVFCHSTNLIMPRHSMNKARAQSTNAFRRTTVAARPPGMVIRVPESAENCHLGPAGVAGGFAPASVVGSSLRTARLIRESCATLDSHYTTRVTWDHPPPPPSPVPLPRGVGVSGCLSLAPWIGGLDCTCVLLVATDGHTGADRRHTAMSEEWERSRKPSNAQWGFFRY